MYKFFYIFIMISSLLCSCANENSLSTINKLEQEVAQSPTAKNQNELLEAYLSWVAVNATDHLKSEELLDKAAILCLSLNEPEQAISLWERILTEHSNNQNNARYLKNISETYKVKLQDSESAYVYDLSILEKYPNSEEAKKLNINSNTSLSKMSGDLRNSILDNDNFDPNKAKQLIAANKIETFTNKDAESSAKLLWESSELARALDKPKESLQILDQIIAKYPSFSNMANVEFMKAFTLDYNLHEFEKAKPLYESFLKKYHAHPLANDAKFMLEQNGKNDEDISKAIIKK